VTELENKIAEYFKCKKDISAVYLFGSIADRKEKRFSDIDIGILFNYRALKTAHATQSACIMELGRILRKDIHPVILNTAGEIFLEQILKKGKCLVVNNEKENISFKMISLSKIMDFSYLYRQIQSRFTKSLMKERSDGR
jgi:predicted nucleotidyltransferase